MNKNILRTALVAAVLATAAGNAAADDGVLELGNFTNADMTYTGSSWEDAPVNLFYKYSGGQIIYPASMLTEIADVNGQIKSLTFKLKEDGMIYSDLTFDMTMYAEMIDTDRIGEKDASTYNFLPYSTTGSKATLSCTHEPLCYEGDFEITLTFDTPVTVTPGKSLLLTTVAEHTETDNYMSYTSVLSYTFMSPAKEYCVAFYGSDSSSFADLAQGAEINTSHYSYELPVAKVDYTYSAALPQAEAPVFTPASGSQLGPDATVTITSPSEGARIYYTLERDAEPETLYTGPIAIDHACTVTALAKGDAYEPSEKATATYSLKYTKRPTFGIPDGCPVAANEKVTIAAEEGAEILYTLDAEGTPDTPYPADGIALSGPAKIRAIATAPGCYPSNEAEAEYTVTELNAKNIGPYFDTPDDDNTFIGTNWYNAPIIPSYNTSVCQMLYLPSELEGFDNETVLRELRFRFLNETCFSEYESTVKVNLQCIDEQAFPYDNNNSKYMWFAFDAANPAATVPLYIDFLENYSIGWGEISIPLGDDGFRYEAGKSLLITVTNESLACLDGSEYPQFMKYNTTEERTATFSSMYVPFTDAIADNPYVYPGSYADYNYYSYMSDNNQPAMRILSEQKHFDAITAPAIDAPDADAPVEYFNLQGVKVTNPSGLVIRRQGNHTTKVLIP